MLVSFGKRRKLRRAAHLKNKRQRLSASLPTKFGACLVPTSSRPLCDIHALRTYDLKASRFSSCLRKKKRERELLIFSVHTFYGGILYKRHVRGERFTRGKYTKVRKRVFSRSSLFQNRFFLFPQTFVCKVVNVNDPTRLHFGRWSKQIDFTNLRRQRYHFSRISSSSIR